MASKDWLKERLDKKEYSNTWWTNFWETLLALVMVYLTYGFWLDILF